jgi:hypothetical protein
VHAHQGAQTLLVASQLVVQQAPQLLLSGLTLAPAHTLQLLPSRK